MSQFNAPVRRAGGSIDVYTGLLFASFVILAAGIFLLATANIEHSGSGTGGGGGPIKLID